jgi:hypothetical protein
LSLLNAFPNAQVRITLGKSNFKTLSIPKTTHHVVLCLDNDGKSETSKNWLKDVAERLQSMGKSVWISQPETAKTDYNDVLKRQGLEAVKTNIENAISYTHFKETSTTQATLKSEVLEKESEVLPPHLSPKAAAELITETKLNIAHLYSVNIQSARPPTVKTDEQILASYENLSQEKAFFASEKETNNTALSHTIFQKKADLEQTIHPKSWDKEPEL